MIKEKVDVKRNKILILGLRNMDFEVKNSKNRFYNIILDIAKERISDLEDNIMNYPKCTPQVYQYGSVAQSCPITTAP